MLKKIKNLTEENIDKICSHQGDCHECPLYTLPSIKEASNCYEIIQELKKLLEKKVEVKDNE